MISVIDVLLIAGRYLPIKERLLTANVDGTGVTLTHAEVKVILDVMDMAADGIEELVNR